jgi:hypothetical protein
MTSHVNIGVRHILPIYIGFSIMAGGAGAFAQCHLNNFWPRHKF